MFVDDHIINNGKETFYGHHRHTRQLSLGESLVASPLVKCSITSKIDIYVSKVRLNNLELCLEHPNIDLMFTVKAYCSKEMVFIELSLSKLQA